MSHCVYHPASSCASLLRSIIGAHRGSLRLFLEGMTVLGSKPTASKPFVGFVGQREERLEGHTKRLRAGSHTGFRRHKRTTSVRNTTSRPPKSSSNMGNRRKGKPNTRTPTKQESRRKAHAAFVETQRDDHEGARCDVPFPELQSRAMPPKRRRPGVTRCIDSDMIPTPGFGATPA